MDYPKFNVSNQMEESIREYRVHSILQESNQVCVAE